MTGTQDTNNKLAVNVPKTKVMLVTNKNAQKKLSEIKHNIKWGYS